MEIAISEIHGYIKTANGTTALAEVWWTGAVHLATTIDLLEATHTDAFTRHRW
jgi:hypothetical protein